MLDLSSIQFLGARHVRLRSQKNSTHGFHFIFISLQSGQELKPKKNPHFCIRNEQTCLPLLPILCHAPTPSQSMDKGWQICFHHHLFLLGSCTAPPRLHHRVGNPNQKWIPIDTNHFPPPLSLRPSMDKRWQISASSLLNSCLAPLALHN